MDAEYGSDNSSSSDENILGSDSDPNSMTEYSEAFVESEFNDMPDLQDVSDSSAHSEFKYMESKLDESDSGHHSEEARSDNDLIVEGRDILLHEGLVGWNI